MTLHSMLFLTTLYFCAFQNKHLFIPWVDRLANLWKMTGETRMLERRVSNNRADLNSDQQLNYFLSWFQSWSDLQKSDFIPILAAKIDCSSTQNGTGSDDIHAEMNGLSLVNGKPLSLFQCQLKLFKEWSTSWNEDKKEYLLLRLKDLDAIFYDKYEEHLKYDGKEDEKPKDYFEPGVPAELVRASRKTSSAGSSPNVSINGDHDSIPEVENQNNGGPLSTIQEDE